MSGNDAGVDFPSLAPTALTVKSHPFAASLKAGERLILAFGGGSWELTPDANPQRLTIVTGSGFAGILELLVVEGTLAFAE